MAMRKRAGGARTESLLKKDGDMLDQLEREGFRRVA